MKSQLTQEELVILADDVLAARAEFNIKCDAYRIAHKESEAAFKRTRAAYTDFTNAYDSLTNAETRLKEAKGD